MTALLASYGTGFFASYGTGLLAAIHHPGALIWVLVLVALIGAAVAFCLEKIAAGVGLLILAVVVVALLL